jgi:hypothetical protein
MENPFAEISIKHPVHVLAHDPSRERIQRMMRAASGPKPVGEPEKVRPAPRGAMRKEMKDDKHLIRAGWDAGPGLMQRPGEAGDGQGAGSRARGQASRQCDGRAALPDARARASKTER